MTGTRVGYCCPGGGVIGWGHVSRGRAVVDRAGQGSWLLVGEGYDEVARGLAQSGIDTPVRPWLGPAAPVDPAEGCWDVLVVDHYDLDARWIEATSMHIPTYVVDDWMRVAPAATGLVNPNVGARTDDYVGSRITRWFVGPEYALLRPEVGHAMRGRRLERRANRLLITLGGSDPQDVTRDVIECALRLQWADSGAVVDVVVGPSYRPKEIWPARGPNGARVRVTRAPRDFLDRCVAADLVVCSASTVASELAYLGRPFIPLAYAENQRRIAQGWAAEGIGPGLDTRMPDWRSRLSEQLTEALRDPILRRRIAERAMAVVDGRGAERLLEAWS